jgi:hypothetical protein
MKFQFLRWLSKYLMYLLYFLYLYIKKNYFLFHPYFVCPIKMEIFFYLIRYLDQFFYLIYLLAYRTKIRLQQEGYKKDYIINPKSMHTL